MLKDALPSCHSNMAKVESHQAFDPRTQGEMFPLQLLRSPFANHMELRVQMPLIGTPAISIKTTNTQGREQSLEFHQRSICTPAKDVSHNPGCVRTRPTFTL